LINRIAAPEANLNVVTDARETVPQSGQPSPSANAPSDQTGLLAKTYALTGDVMVENMLNAQTTRRDQHLYQRKLTGQTTGFSDPPPLQPSQRLAAKKRRADWRVLMRPGNLLKQSIFCVQIVEQWRFHRRPSSVFNRRARGQPTHGLHIRVPATPAQAQDLLPRHQIGKHVAPWRLITGC
jgi:hypothetical protein